MKGPAFILMIVSLVGLFCGCCIGRVRPDYFSSEEHIRSRLLSHTPIGDSGTNVLDFVVNKMCSAGVSVAAYAGYVDAVQPVMSHQLRVVRQPETEGRITYGRCIWAVKYPVGMTSTEVRVTWRFDASDMLTNIVVEKRIISL